MAKALATLAGQALARLLNKWPKHSLRSRATLRSSQSCHVYPKHSLRSWATLSAPAEFGWGTLLCGQKKLGNCRRGPTREVQWAPYGLAHVTSWPLIKMVKALFLVMGHADRRFIRASGFLSCRAAALSLDIEPVCSVKNFAMIGSRLREGIGVEHRKDTPGFGGW